MGLSSVEGVRCMLMRGGSSKGLFFVKGDLPAEPAERDALLMRLMGTPDSRQIDGLGGAHPLTSKVAIVSMAERADADLEYLFLQLGVDEALVSDRQNCGNLLAGVGPFAVERGLLKGPDDGATLARIHMINTDSVATATFQLADGRPAYGGDTEVAGVPGSAAPIRLDFEDIAGSSCGALLPTGQVVDVIDGVECSLVDNGMPVVILRADAVGKTGHESCEDLEADSKLRSRLEQIRLEAGRLMGLGNVLDTTIPKMTMVSEPRAGGSLCTRTFIPHRCHDAIGVLGAVSVATGALLPDSPGHSVMGTDPDLMGTDPDLVGDLAGTDPDWAVMGTDPDWAVGSVVLEHPSGAFEAAVQVEMVDGAPVVKRAGIVRTARKLMDGVAFERDYP